MYTNSNSKKRSRQLVGRERAAHQRAVLIQVAEVTLEAVVVFLLVGIVILLIQI